MNLPGRAIYGAPTLARANARILALWLVPTLVVSGVLLQCKSGGRSAKAAASLVARGFTQVVNLEGGINAWVEAFRPDLPTY